MTRKEREVAQKLSDSISRQAAVLQTLGFDMGDLFDNLRDVNIGLVDDDYTPTTRAPSVSGSGGV